GESDHSNRSAAFFAGSKKKKTRRWERRVSLLLLSEFTVSSMRPGCRSFPFGHAPLLFSSLYSLLLLLFLVLLLVSGQNLTEPFAVEHRFLSVCALTDP